MISRGAQRYLAGTGFSGVDGATRQVANITGFHYVKRIEKLLLRDPSNKVWKKSMIELGGDPEIILAAKGVSELQMNRMIGTFADFTAGGTAPSQIPTWIQNNAEHWRILNQYRKFLASNMATEIRGIRRAPSLGIALKRALRGIASAQVIGSLTGGAMRFIQNREDPFGLTLDNLQPELRPLGVIGGHIVQNYMYARAQLQWAVAFALLEGREIALWGLLVFVMVQYHLL